MGGCCSTEKAPDVVFADITSSDAQLYPGPLLVRLLQASNIPIMDVTSESDVFVKAEVVDPVNGVVGTADWPVKWDATHPCWDSARIFGTDTPKQNAMLRLHFYDHDTNNADDYIGTAEAKVGAILGEEATTTLPILLHKNIRESQSGAAIVTLRREPVARFSGQRVVYLVRHGESVWNKAQADKRVDKMLADVDHPLNATGRAQAETLLAALHAGGPHADELLRAEAVMCSPLTRALQTCLIGLQPLLLPAGEGAAARVVDLNPNLREKRNAGGKDSSGKWTGEALTAGVHTELDKLLADAPDRAAALKSVPLTLGHVQNKWWLGSAESVELVKERIAEALCQLRFADARSQVLVGHSHYFREIFRHFAAEGCVLKDAAGGALPTEEMRAKKLSNAGVVRCVLDFDNDPRQPLVEVQLLFGSQFVS